MLNASCLRISHKHCNDFSLNEIDAIKSSQLSISKLVKAKCFLTTDLNVVSKKMGKSAFIEPGYISYGTCRPGIEPATS